MSFFTFTKLVRALLLTAAVAVSAVLWAGCEGDVNPGDSGSDVGSNSVVEGDDLVGDWLMINEGAGLSIDVLLSYGIVTVYSFTSSGVWMCRVFHSSDVSGVRTWNEGTAWTYSYSVSGSTITVSAYEAFATYSVSNGMLYLHIGSGDFTGTKINLADFRSSLGL